MKRHNIQQIGVTDIENILLSLIEKNISIKSKKIYKKKQLGDVLNTRSNNQIEKKLFKFKFQTDLEKGIKKFINWFLLEYE